MRKTFLSGAFAAVPVAVTIFICWYVDDKTRVISQQLFGRPIPVVGILIALVAIYAFGVLVTSLLGKWLITRIDRLLSRVPGLSALYAAWKQVSLTPGGNEGTFARVVLVPAEGGAGQQLGFCSGEPIARDVDAFCVFIPAAPNPLNGRLIFVPRDKCTMLNASPEDAFKLVLSTGNYVPPAIAEAARRLTDQMEPRA